MRTTSTRAPYASWLSTWLRRSEACEAEESATGGTYCDSGPSPAESALRKNGTTASSPAITTYFSVPVSSR